MRSQGVILLGAQQQASQVSLKVTENASTRAVGRSGTMELRSEVWKGLGDTGRSQAAQLLGEEKLLLQPGFRAPMLAKIPYLPWALRKEDVDATATDGQASEAAPAAKKSRREADFA